MSNESVLAVGERSLMSNKKSVSFDPGRAHFEPYGLTCVNWQKSTMSRPDHHNEVELNLIRSGNLTYLLGGQKTVVEAGKISLFWGAIPHQIIDYQDDSSYLVATIPLQNFLQWRLPECFVQPLMQGKLLSEKKGDRGDLDTDLFERWVADLDQHSQEAEQLVLLEMQARLARLASGFPTYSNGKGLSGVSDAGLSKVEQMACYIAQNYTQKITVQDLAELVNLNPNYAMNLFQKTFGTTLINYLTRHRLSHAQRLLTTSDEAITEIALQSGFQSISRFNDVFNNAFSCSPRNYRKLHR